MFMEPTSKEILKQQKKLLKWKEKDLKEIKAHPDRSIEHFRSIKHEPDVFGEGPMMTSPGSEFELQDWDSHKAVEAWGFEDKKKGLMPKYHQFGPDGQPVAGQQTRGDIHSATKSQESQFGMIHSASYHPDAQAAASQPFEMSDTPIHTAYATRGDFRQPGYYEDERRLHPHEWKVPTTKLQPRDREPLPRGSEFGLEPMSSIPSASPGG